MILTVLSAFAQAESESISQNVARGKRMGFRQGKFPFPYGQILGYRKGLDGKPEVIPEEAEVIRMIFNSYLQGASLLTIKKKLEAGGVLTARGNKKWSSESVQRILQNEKYCGDVLLQKTFIEDVLTGVSKKNTGQLPQYYIENNHEGIVTKQMFREVQAEIARRNSKSAANQRKRHQGRYNSKYALSERLVCGDCGSPYKRVTWNIHGRKQIVWRCVNRLEYGTKFCSHSPSIPEEELHQAILKAVQNLAANFTDEVAAQLDGILRQMKAGENLKAQLQKQLEKAQQEFDRLLEMSLELDESTPFLDDKLRKLSGKIKILKANIAESTDGKGKDEEATKQLTAQDLLIKEYDDILTARIIEKVIVHSRQEIEIYFIGGYTQRLTLYRAIHSYTNARTGKSKTLADAGITFGKVSYYTMDTGSRIKLVREHRGLTQQKLGEMLGYGKSSANRIAQYEMGYRSPKANRLKEIAKAMNIREEIFLMPDETPIDLLRILIWYDWEHEGVLQLATSRTANTPPGKTVSPIIYSEQLPLNRLLLDWADKSILFP